LLSVSQPAISRLLAYTEDRLKLSLFSRVRGRIQPTPEAQRLFAEVEHLHQGVVRINDLADELRQRGTGSVRIVASPSMAQTLVPDAVARLRRKVPDLHVDLETLTLLDIVARIGNGSADLGVSSFPVDDPRIASEIIANGKLVVVMPHDHPLARLSTIKAADIALYPLIGFGAQTPYGNIVDRALGASREPLRISTVVRFTPVACAMVKAGAGIAIVDEFVMRGQHWAGIVARPLTPATPMRAYLLTPRFNPLSRTAQAMLDVLRDDAQPKPVKNKPSTRSSSRA
jgi:DNA-binding transcriptional LysR family regulator